MRKQVEQRSGARIAAALLISILAATGCGTTSGPLATRHVKIDVTALQQNADALLDYVEGKRPSLPTELFASGPLASAGEDVAQKLQTVATQMRERTVELAPLKTRQVLGEDNRGYLTLRDEETLKNAGQKNDVQRLMASENDDRKEFYRAIARAAEDSGLTLTRVERMCAARRLARATTGAVVQLPPDGEDFEKLKASPRGAALSESCKPGAWVTLP